MSMERSCSQSSSSPSSVATWLMVNTAEMAATSGCLAVQHLAGLPVPGQQLVDLAGRMYGDPAEHVGQPSLRIDSVQLGGDDERVHRRGALAAAVGAREQP